MLDVLHRVHGANPTYPPREDVDGSYGSLQKWLMDDPNPDRFVAVERGTVLGHVQVVPAHAYLIDHLAANGCVSNAAKGYGEIVKLFVDPDVGGRGTGMALLAHGRGVARARGMQPALAVVVTSEDAIRLYERSDLVACGSFNGIHGVNQVFVEPLPDPSCSFKPGTLNHL